MWRCTKCNFLYTGSESPQHCEICRGDGFIRVIIGAQKRPGDRRNKAIPGQDRRSA